MKYPMAHRIKIPKPYVPREATDIRKTIAAERKRLAEAEACKPLRKITPLRRQAK
jgi:hypothetical protein